MTSPAGGEQCIERYRSLNSILSDEKVKLLYRVNDRSVTVAWKTKNFNLFVSFAPLVSRKNAIQSITYVAHSSNIYTLKYFSKLLQWLRKKEPELLATKNYHF